LYARKKVFQTNVDTYRAKKNQYELLIPEYDFLSFLLWKWISYFTGKKTLPTVVKFQRQLFFYLFIYLFSVLQVDIFYLSIKMEVILSSKRIFCSKKLFWNSLYSKNIYTYLTLLVDNFNQGLLFMNYLTFNYPRKQKRVKWALLN
jgi:hypothetical protein